MSPLKKYLFSCKFLFKNKINQIFITKQPQTTTNNQIPNQPVMSTSFSLKRPNSSTTGDCRAVLSLDSAPKRNYWGVLEAPVIAPPSCQRRHECESCYGGVSCWCPEYICQKCHAARCGFCGGLEHHSCDEDLEGFHACYVMDYATKNKLRFSASLAVLKEQQKKTTTKEQ